MSLQTQRRKILLAGAAIFLAAFVQAEQLKVGDAFPDLHSFDLSGKVPDTQGKVVLIDFWASWCAPCKVSFPFLDKINARYDDAEFAIIAVSVDEKLSNMEKFLTLMPVSFTTLHDSQQKLVEACEVKTMPTSFLLDCDGNIAFIHNGFKRGETDKELIEQIDSLIGCTGEK